MVVVKDEDVRTTSADAVANRAAIVADPLTNGTTTTSSSDGSSATSIHHRKPFTAATSTTTACTDHTTSSPPQSPNTTPSNNNDWAHQEGHRRGRADQVMKDMRFLTSMAAIGGFLFGYDTGVISGAMLPLARAFDLSAWQQEVVVSSTVFAALIASLAGGSLNDIWGRKHCCLLASGIFTLGSMVLLVCWDYPTLVVGRIIVGLGIGIASLTTPVYIAEMALPRMRGQLVTVNALLVTIGQFTAGMVDGILDELLPNAGGWRIMLGLAAVPALVMMWGFGRLPESPRWLAQKGHWTEAMRVLQQFRESDEDAQQEWQEIQDALPADVVRDHEAAQQEQHDHDNSNHMPRAASTSESSSCLYSSFAGAQNFLWQVREMLREKGTRKALFLGCGLMWIQQLSGINTVMYYAASIYEMSQFDEVTSVWLSGFTALAQVAGIAASIYLVEHLGRRQLVLTSLGMVAICLMGLGGSFYMSRVYSRDVLATDDTCHQIDALVWSGLTTYCYDCAQMDGCGFCGGRCVAGDEMGPFTNTTPAMRTTSFATPATYSFEPPVCARDTTWIYHSCSNHWGWLSVFFMIAYLLAFGIGMGGLPWTINSEIFPSHYRSVAVSCSTASNWIGNLIVSATFLSISRPESMTAYGAFWMYGSVSVIGFVWLYFALPETKGLSLEEIEQMFRGDMPRHGRRGAGYDAIDSIDEDSSYDADVASRDSRTTSRISLPEMEQQQQHQGISAESPPRPYHSSRF